MNFYPDYITTADHSWLALVVDTYVNCNELQIRRIHSRLGTLKIPNASNARYQRAIRYLDKQVAETTTEIDAREIRTAMFMRIFSGSKLPNDQEIDAHLTSATTELRLHSPEILKRHLLSDIEGEAVANCENLNRNLYELANEINLVYVKSLLRHANFVNIVISDNSRRVIRQAKLKGLICNVSRMSSHLCLSISGPLSLLQKTTIYGNALASLLESVVWCEQFEVKAKCTRQKDTFEFKISSGDPIRPGKRPKSFDSKIEDKFATAVSKKLPHWRLVHEPEPLETSKGIIFPDFLLHHQSDENLKFYCEIVGFWTRDYLNRKMRQWALIEGVRFVLCISEKLRVTDEALPDDAPVYFFKGVIDPIKVLSLAFGEKFN